MVWLNDLGDCFESSWRELLALTILLFDSYFFLLRTYVLFAFILLCIEMFGWISFQSIECRLIVDDKANAM